MNLKNQTKQCLYCGKYYIDRKQEVGLFGVCPDCKIEPTLGCTCNKCGTEISLQEYDSNINGYCESCQEEEEEREYEEDM